MSKGLKRIQTEMDNLCRKVEVKLCTIDYRLFSQEREEAEISSLSCLKTIKNIHNNLLHRKKFNRNVHKSTYLT